LPALIALRTGRGASLGGIAVPSAFRVATPGTAVGVVVVVVVVAPGGPAPPVCAMAETEPLTIATTPTSVEIATRRVQLCGRSRTQTPPSACGVSCRAGAKGACAPTVGGLAPENLVSPFSPTLGRDSALPRKLAITGDKLQADRSGPDAKKPRRAHGASQLPQRFGIPAPLCRGWPTE